MTAASVLKAAPKNNSSKLRLMCLWIRRGWSVCVCVCVRVRTVGCLQPELWKSAKYNKIKSAPLLYIHRTWSKQFEVPLKENEVEGIRIAFMWKKREELWGAGLLSMTRGVWVCERACARVLYVIDLLFPWPCTWRTERDASCSFFVGHRALSSTPRCAGTWKLRPLTYFWVSESLKKKRYFSEEGSALLGSIKEILKALCF